ncbi:MgtC/SapB family protein [Stackebrandtia nassauensis]|uniref:MgtC/SapB transporter n=1 Tax=Stackebrandtia nassauensis (strain DSM 44728 / CIP 108903 / NRRL B-16338 / NBRC 102104 / LLR-40K-21) TaxID=446470 RepID=D3Q8Q7_STANL|nr:MgtC/SapB family protein [Stackebrandtia nassauensis]ADD44499.1 MgtC/SapB transporter [Stackebrandtia nassauensis DSM 44728]
MFWTQLGLLALAVLLGTLIGAEREFEGKPAGMRTHAIIAVGAALFTLASKYGFPGADGEVTDTSRIAAQIVSGIGFLGAGVIFFHRNLVFGMTTAASIWSTTAIAMVCTAGMPLIAVGATVVHLGIVSGLQPLERFIGRYAKHSGRLRLTYTTGKALEDALKLCTSRGFTVTEVSTERTGEDDVRKTTLTVRGRGNIGKLTSALSDAEHVRGVSLHED